MSVQYERLEAGGGLPREALIMSGILIKSWPASNTPAALLVVGSLEIIAWHRPCRGIES